MIGLPRLLPIRRRIPSFERHALKSLRLHLPEIAAHHQPVSRFLRYRPQHLHQQCRAGVGIELIGPHLDGDGP
jgi:hypothetical protein